MCPCKDRDDEIKLYGHCFCGLYVSRYYVKKWRPGKTISMLSNRNVQYYMEIPTNIKEHYIKVHVFFDEDIKDVFLNQKDEHEQRFDIKNFLDESYTLKNRRYGFKDNVLFKFKKDVIHHNIQIWFKNLEESLDKDFNIRGDCGFNIYKYSHRNI